MLRHILTVLFFVTFSCSAYACEPEWPQYHGGEDDLIYGISKVDIAFEGIPLSYKMVNPPNEEVYAELKFKVTRCVKGNCQKYVVVRSWGGDEGANCGMASALKVKLPTKQTYWVSGWIDPRASNNFDKSVWLHLGSLFQKSNPTGHVP